MLFIHSRARHSQTLLEAYPTNEIELVQEVKTALKWLRPPEFDALKRVLTRTLGKLSWTLACYQAQSRC